MKKWELLKYAYDNYHKGTKFSWPNGSTFISNGSFYIEAGTVFSVSESGNDNTLFDGSKWAEIVTEQPSPKQDFIISEDGEPLYDGDKYFHVTKVDGVWKINKSFEPDYALSLTKTSLVNNNPDFNKAFKSYDAAVKFIEDQVVIVSGNSTYPIHVTADSIIIQTAKHAPGDNLVMSADEMEECLEFYKLLNEK